MPWVVVYCMCNQMKGNIMKTFNIEVSEEQLVLIQKAIDCLALNESQPTDELEIMSASIDDIFEEDDTSITYGLCY